MDINLRVILLVVLSLVASFIIAAFPLLSPVWVLLTIWASQRLLRMSSKAKRNDSYREGNLWRKTSIGIVVASVLILGVWGVVLYSATGFRVGSSYAFVQQDLDGVEFVPEMTREPMNEATRAQFDLTLTAAPPIRMMATVTAAVP